MHERALSGDDDVHGGLVVEDACIVPVLRQVEYLGHFPREAESFCDEARVGFFFELLLRERLVFEEDREFACVDMELVA